MKILAVETSTRLASVAVVDDDHLLGEVQHSNCPSHASVLIPSIHCLLEGCHLTLEELDGLGVSIGPGSFTGLRVGLSTMVGIRFTTQLPLVTVPTLEVMAWNLKGQEEAICPVLKAGKEEVFWALFRWEEGNLLRLTEDRFGSISQLIESIDKKCVMFGEGWFLHQDLVRESLGELVIPGTQDIGYPSARHVGCSSLSSFRTRQYAAKQLRPYYLQRPEAEIQWEMKSRNGYQ